MTLSSVIFEVGEKIKPNMQPPTPLMMKQAYFQPEREHQSILVWLASQTECLLSLPLSAELLGGGELSG